MSKRQAQLADWLWELGVCFSCRNKIATAQVRREETRRKDIEAELDCDDVDQCRALATRGWHSMPAPKASGTTT